VCFFKKRVKNAWWAINISNEAGKAGWVEGCFSMSSRLGLCVGERICALWPLSCRCLAEPDLKSLKRNDA
jgi:hypothetical protein